MSHRWHCFQEDVHFINFPVPISSPFSSIKFSPNSKNVYGILLIYWCNVQKSGINGVAGIFTQKINGVDGIFV